MPDTLDATGLTTKTLSEIKTEIEDNLKLIYGVDINIDQNSPDGQMINLYSQAAVDYREILTTIYNSFDPDNTVGTTLDSRVRINYITKNGGSYTIQPIQIIVSQTVEFEGLDEDAANIDGAGYTIQDNSGTQYILIDSVTLTAGTYVKNFRAKDIGLVESVIGTINIPVTILLGVDSVDNLSAPLDVGEDEETDAELRIRRSASVAINANGFLNGLTGAFLNLEGVEAAKSYENYTSVVDADGIPAHGIWAIVEGGSNVDIGVAIMNKKAPGSNMKGAVVIAVTPSFTAKFDRPTAADLHIQFNIKRTVTGFSFDEAAIKTYIKDNVTYDIGEAAYTTNITQVAQDGVDVNGGGGVVLDLEISDDGIVWVDYLETATKDKKWTIDETNITITVI